MIPRRRPLHPVRIELTVSPCLAAVLVVAIVFFTVRTIARARRRASLGSDTTQEIMHNLYARYGKYWDDDEERLEADVAERVEESA
ncbi:hypothetical protein ABCS02_10070 [Microbacterium sp. X-17]|uniref:hypothetical protein n=1 Tax=Microbacterium sp. X-17 TaxID=3144404 RepID=UPI0031F49D9B